jgi:hypothetical protein
LIFIQEEQVKYDDTGIFGTLILILERMNGTMRPEPGHYSTTGSARSSPSWNTSI